jgi:hypothetical protein
VNAGHGASGAGIHAKCGAVRAEHGRTLICWKSPSHTASTDPGRRDHYDPGADEHWADDAPL